MPDTMRGAAAIVGIGELKPERSRPGRNAMSLLAEAAYLAIQDAGLTKKDIDVPTTVCARTPKDLDLMLAAARTHDVPLPMIALTRQLMQAAVGAGFADEDYMAIVKLAEQQSGLSSEEFD